MSEKPKKVWKWTAAARADMAAQFRPGGVAPGHMVTITCLSHEHKQPLTYQKERGSREPCPGCGRPG